MEIISYGTDNRLSSSMKDTVINFCHTHSNCRRCQLRAPLCSKGGPYRMITEWTDSELAEALKLIGGAHETDDSKPSWRGSRS